MRVTHLPTGTVVAIQDERSQHRNKAKAMKLLARRVNGEKAAQAAAARSASRQASCGVFLLDARHLGRAPRKPAHRGSIILDSRRL